MTNDSARETSNVRLHSGAQVPRFEVTTIEGQRVRYADVWQRRNLLLVTIDRFASPSADEYVSILHARAREIADADTALVITSETFPGVAKPGVLVADRWGEITYIASAEGGDASGLPSPDELLAWIHFVRIQCPECPP